MTQYDFATCLACRKALGKPGRHRAHPCRGRMNGYICACRQCKSDRSRALARMYSEERGHHLPRHERVQLARQGWDPTSGYLH